MSRRYRVAVVGAGIGAAHVEGYLASPERFEVAAVCDLDLERASGLAARAPGAQAVGDLGALLVDPAIDILDLCTPPVTHRSMALDALRTGKHVVCEKPLCASPVELDELEAAVERADRFLLPVYQYRYGRGLGQLRRLVEGGLAGRPFVATIETHWDRRADYYTVPWRGRFDRELGGAVVSHAIHAHDMLTQALGPVVRVAARVATRVNPIQTEDCAAALLEMGSGALVTSSVTLGAATNTTRFRFCFDRLTAESGTAPYTPGAEPWTFLARHPTVQAEIDAVVDAYPAHAHGFARLLELFHDALDGRGPVPVTLNEARHSLEIASAIYHSAATGEPVALPLPREHPAAHGWLHATGK